MKLVNLPEYNGRYQIDVETGDIWSLISPGRKGTPTRLKEKYDGGWNITCTPNGYPYYWSRKNSADFIAKHKATQTGSINGSKATDALITADVYYVVADGDFATNDRGDIEFSSLDQAKKAAIKLAEDDDWDYDEIEILARIGKVEKKIVATIV